MDIAATIRTRILMIDAVRAIVSTRVYTGQLKQSGDLPAIVVNRLPSVHHAHLRGGERVRRTRVQVTCVAQSRELAVAVEAAVEGDNAGSGLAYWRGTMGSPSVDVRACIPADGSPVEFFDPAELRQYRVNRDYWVHHT